MSPNRATVFKHYHWCKNYHRCSL